MDALTLVVDNNELSDLYSIIDDGYHRSDSVVRGWKKLMGDEYRKRDKHCLVFNKDDIPILYNIMRDYKRYGYESRLRLRDDITEAINRWS